MGPMVAGSPEPSFDPSTAACSSAWTNPEGFRPGPHSKDALYLSRTTDPAGQLAAQFQRHSKGGASSGAEAPAPLWTGAATKPRSTPAACFPVAASLAA